MSAVASLALDVRGFLAGCDLAKQAMDSVRKSSMMAGESPGLQKLQAAAVGVAATIVGLGVAMVKGTQAALNLGARLVDVSYEVGLTAKETLALENAIVDFGGQATDAVPAAKSMAGAIKDISQAAPELKDALQTAGVSAEKLAPMSMLDRMRAVAGAIDNIQHPTMRAKAAAQAFGDAGLRMVEALRPNNLASAAAATGTQAEVLEKNAGVFARVTQLLGVQGSTLASIGQAVKSKIQGLFVGIASEVAPQVLAILEASRSGGVSLADSIRKFVPALAPLADIIEKVVKFDLTGLGQQIGAAVGAVFQAVRSGDAIRYLQLGLEVAATEFENLMRQAFGGISTAVAQLFASMSMAPMLDGIKQTFSGIGNLFIGIITRGIANALLSVKEMGGVFASMIPEGAIAKLLDVSTRAKMAGKADLDAGSNLLVFSAKQMGTQLLENAKKTAEAFRGGKDAAAQTSTEDARREMSDIKQRAKAAAQQTAEAARAARGTPGARLGEIVQPSAGEPMLAGKGPQMLDFVSSLTKIGGNQFGPGAPDPLAIQRQQLAAQERLIEKQNQTNILLKMIESKNRGETLTPVYG